MSDIFKVITIGDCGVGKNSIIRRYVLNNFEDNLPTIGINFSFKNITLKNGKLVKLKLIDTAGQEKYKSLAKSYYKNVDGVLFVFAVNEKKTFDHIREWMTLFKENNNGKDGIPKYLIGNNDDLDKDKWIDQDLIDQFLNETNNEFEYRSVSALKKDNRIDELYQDLTEKMIKNFKEVKPNYIELEKIKDNKKRTKCKLCEMDIENR